MASEDVKEPDKNSESSPAAHLATAKKVLKRLRAELKDAAPEDLDDSDVVNLRRKFIHECERAMVAEELRRDVYGYLWRDAFYSTLFIYRGAWKLHNGLNSKQKEELRSFVSKAVRYLLKLRKTHRDLAYFIFLNVGDMYRYCFDVLREEEHIKNALKFYGQALAVKPGDGHPFNQLGILYREQNPWKAASMFLRSSIVSSPYDKAEENFLLLRATGFMENLKQNTWEYVYGMFDHFNRITIDELKSTWMETLRQELDNDKPDLKKVLDSFSIVLLGSILAVHEDHGNDKTRYLIHSICEDIKFLVKEFSDRCRESSVDERAENRIRGIRPRRRRRRREESDEEDDDDEEYKLFSESEDESDEEKESDNEKTEEQEGTDLILPLLAIVIDWFTQIEKRLKEKKLSVGLRMDLQTVLQLILDYINRYVDELSPFLGEKTTSDVVWYLKSPGTALPESFFYELLPKLMESAESWSLFPIYFDRYYKLLGKNQDLKAMKDMARIRLEVTENDEKLEMPKYTLFEPDAIKSKLHIIRAVVTSRQIRVFISKETIRRFDSLKSKDPDARSAVRFLEDSMKSNEIELISLDETRSSVLAKSFLSSVEGDDEFLIVTSGNSPRKSLASTDSHKIYLEGVDKFFERFSITQRKGPV